MLKIVAHRPADEKGASMTRHLDLEARRLRGGHYPGATMNRREFLLSSTAAAAGLVCASCQSDHASQTYLIDSHAKTEETRAKGERNADKV